MLENRAKNQYGLDFKNKNNPIERKNQICKDSKNDPQ